MHNKSETVRALTATFVVSLLLFAAAPIFAAQAPTSPAALTTSPDTSLNWAGYAATGGTYTAVSGSWTVPKVTADTAGNYLSADTAWVGIGGVLGKDLIQAGTQAITEPSGRITYQAWYEMLPDNSQPLPVDIRPGDSVSVSIDRKKSNQWSIDFNNTTTGENYSLDVAYVSSLSSAEWMVETPSTDFGILPLDNFGSVPFTAGSTVRDGTSQTISSSGAKPIQLTNLYGETLASPSDLSVSGDGFTVTRTDNQTTPGFQTRRFGYSTTFPDYYFRFHRDQGLSFERPWWWNFGF
ncbi:MAG: G1 family glutamic endopeptidase [Candidatus Saccharibacteria bacterium]